MEEKRLTVEDVLAEMRRCGDGYYASSIRMLCAVVAEQQRELHRLGEALRVKR